MSGRRFRPALVVCLAPLALCAGCGSGGGNGLGEVGVYEPDGGLFFGSGDASTSAALDAHVEENHVTVTFVTLSCTGDCATVEAVGTGGFPPYTFKWDDGSTTATRQVCPASSTSYQVTVTDTATSGEFAHAAETAQVSLAAKVIACPEADASSSDAGAQLDAGVDVDSGTPCVDLGDIPWTGCQTMTFGLAPSPFWLCKDTAQTDPVGLCLAKPLRAGQKYEFQVTHTIQTLTGPVPQMNVWGSTASCAESQVFTAQTLPIQSPFTGTVTVSFCVTADAHYPELVYDLEQQSLSSINGDAVTLQICTGCGAEP